MRLKPLRGKVEFTVTAIDISGQIRRSQIALREVACEPLKLQLERQSEAFLVRDRQAMK